MKTLMIGSTLLAASALVMLFCTQPALAADAIVKVTLNDTSPDINLDLKLGMGMKGDMTKATMSIKAEPDTIAPGVVTFQVVNASKTTIHEMILSPAADLTKPLPFNANENRVDEEKAEHLGEVSELEVGKTGALTVTLKPGTYLIYCNIPGHYMSAMWTTITVK